MRVAITVADRQSTIDPREMALFPYRKKQMQSAFACKIH